MTADEDDPPRRPPTVIAQHRVTHHIKLIAAMQSSAVYTVHLNTLHTALLHGADVMRVVRRSAP